MKRTWKTSLGRGSSWALAIVATLGATAWVSPPAATIGSPSASSSGPSAADNKYIGAKKCKSCHDSDEKGNQYGAWEHAGHSKAFETLASGRAKEVAAGLGIADAQKSDQCLSCHTTAFGVDKKEIKRGFEVEAGVQCESCHGPGDNHSKARFKAAASDDPDAKPEPGEIVLSPDQAACTACHNKKSPTFKNFCFYERVAKIRHLRPGTDPSTKLVCGCAECGCVDACPDDGCGVPPTK